MESQPDTSASPLICLRSTPKVFADVYSSHHGKWTATAVAVSRSKIALTLSTQPQAISQSRLNDRRSKPGLSYDGGTPVEERSVSDWDPQVAQGPNRCGLRPAKESGRVARHNQGYTPIAVVLRIESALSRWNLMGTFEIMVIK